MRCICAFLFLIENANERAFKIIGTAGHIDHGKSSLIKALTGTDPDRLAEEQQRGMTIDLGFAFLDKDIAFIDVPGHEKFIKNMVAGASTVDAALMVIAADDGVMPQTREHLDILQILQIKHGIIALTKIDMVEEEWLDMVVEDIRELAHNSFLRDAPIMRVSSSTGEGVAALRDALIELVQRTPSRRNRGLFWMPVDRSFSVKGHGTVVTGSILSGSIKSGDAMELLPAQKPLRIRGIQTHGQSVDSAGLGERAAFNIMNISKEDINRGDVIASPDYFEPSMRFDARLFLLPGAAKSLTNRTRIRLHLGTREIMARIKLLGCDKIEPGSEAFVQLLTEDVAVAQKRDPFVIRQYSPQVTIGGGVILDANPKAHKRSDKSVLAALALLVNFDPEELVLSTLMQSKKEPITFSYLCKQTGLASDQAEHIIKELLAKNQAIQIGKKPAYLHRQNVDALKSTIINIIQDYHKNEPLRPGINRANLRASSGIKAANAFDRLVRELLEEGKIEERSNIIKLAGRQIRLGAEDEMFAEKIYDLLNRAGFNTPPAKIMADQLQVDEATVQKLLGALLGMEKAVRLEGDIYFTTAAVDRAKEMLRAFAQKKKEISVAEFREMLNTSRKFAMPLLGYFDAQGITSRVGDVRQILAKT